MFLVTFFLFLLSGFSLSFDVILKSNYPLGKNNIISVINKDNYKQIIKILKEIPEIKEIKYKIQENKLYIYIKRYPIIKKIKIEGNVFFLNNDIKNILGLEEGGILYSENEKIYEEILRQAYINSGFLGAKVKVKINVNKKGEAYIKVSVKENNLYFLGGAEFRGAKSFNKRELLKASGIIVGKVFNFKDVEKGEENLENFYRKKGFYESFVFFKELKKKSIKSRFIQALFPLTDNFLEKLSIGLSNLVNHPLATLKAIWGDVKVGIPVYEVYEGTKYTIIFRGNKFFSDKELLSLFDKENVGLDIFTLENLKEKILKLYKEKGFFDVKVNYKFRKNRVTFIINEGKRYTAQLEIDGERKVFPYDRNTVNKLIEEKIENLRKEGYLGVVYEINERVDNKKKKIYIKVSLNKGFRYILGGVRIRDREFKYIEEKINKSLPSIFHGEVIEKVYRTIFRKLRENGYFDAKILIDKRENIKGDNLIIYYDIKVNRGQRYTYGYTLIYGIKKTTFREVNYMLVKDKYFSKENEEESIWNLMESGIFRSVRLDNYIDRKRKKVHRFIYLSEAKRGLFEFSLGYSTFENIKVQGGLTLKNLLGTGLISGMNISKSSKIEEYNLFLKDKFLFSRHFLGDLSLFKDYSKHNSYEFFSRGYSATLGFRFNPFTILSLSYSNFNGRTEGVEKLNGNFSKISLSLIKRYALNLSLSRAFGRRNYYKLSLFFRIKKNIDEKVGIRVKTSYGYVSKKAPIFDRFFLGGYFNMRGYSYESIGSPYGGRQMLYINPEVFFLLKENIEVIFFSEFGKVANRFPSLYKNMKKDIGFSVGLRTPVGLIRGDVAYPLDKKKISTSRLKFYISVDFYF